MSAWSHELLRPHYWRPLTTSIPSTPPTPRPTAITTNAQMSHGGAFRSPPPRRRTSPLSLHTLPPELLVSIASLLPLTSLSQLIRSSRHFFRELHGLTIRKPSFCPWRRRYESHRTSFQAAYNAAEKRAYSRLIEGRDFEAATVQPHQTQLEYETVVEGLLQDFGFVDRRGRGVDNDGDVGMGGTPSAPRTRTLMMDEKLLLSALMGMWRQEDRVVLWFKKLNCDLRLLEDRLERLCPWNKIGMLAPEFENGSPQVMLVYILLTVYLLYGGLQPADIPQLIEDCAPVGSDEVVMEDTEAALCEYFCFVGLFLDIWEAQVFMLEMEPVDADMMQMELWYHGNLRRRLNSKIQKWLDARFVPVKPLMPGSTTEKSSPTNGTLLSKGIPISAPSRGDQIPHPAPTRRSGLERSISWGLDKQLGSALNLGPHPWTAPLQDLLTEEQQRVVDTDLRPGQLMKIRAFAGTGKTRSLVEYAKRRPNKSFIYIAFNNSAKLDAERKFGPNVRC